MNKSGKLRHSKSHRAKADELRRKPKPHGTVNYVCEPIYWAPPERPLRWVGGTFHE